MHEATLVTGILRIAQEEARKHKARLVAVKLEVGLLACVEEQTLKGCFEIFAEDTEARGARLDIIPQPLPCRCRECEADFTLTERRFICPACGGKELTFSGGHGCAVSAIEVEPQESIHE